MREPRSGASRLYRLLLHAYPRSFRERNGAEMERTFRERLADTRARRGSIGLASLWTLTVFDFLRNAPPERLGQARAWWSSRNSPAALAEHNGKRGGGGMDSLSKDVGYAVRTLVRSPAFAIIAVLTIALGIGANTAIFSVVRAVLIAPLPYAEPEELVVVWGEMENRGVEDFPSSPPVLRDMREQTEAFDALVGVNAFQSPLAGDGDPLQIEVAGVTADFFSTLGVQPFLGRDFRPEDALPSATVDDANLLNPNLNPPTVTILSHGFWQQYFGGDPSVLGRTIDLGGNFVEIIGVLPAEFELLLPPAANVSPNVAAWIVPRIDYDAANPLNAFFVVLGRLKPGVSVERAQAEMDAVAAHEREIYQIYNTAGFAIEVVPLHEDLTEEVRPIVLALLGAVGFLLLIACANVANLLLVRASTREREISIRAALGGSRGRLIRQLLIESLVLAGLGGLLGLVLAQAGVQALLELRPENLPRLDDVRVDGWVTGFTALASCAAAIVFGLIPALQGTKTELAGALKERSSLATSPASRLLRNAVVIGEVALSVVLLIGAGLMVRSFVELQNVDPGYDTSDVLTFGVTLPFGRYPSPEERHQVQRQLQQRLAGLPGVEAVSGVFPLPLTGPPINGRYGTEEALADESFFRQAAYKFVLPEYFEALGTELLEGRTFTAADEADSAAVAVVDELLAERTWPGESAVGKRLLIRLTTPQPVWVDVIGVVRHQRHEGLGTDSRELLFLTDRYSGSFGNLTWTVRVDGDPMELVPQVRRELAALDPAVPLADIRLFDDYVADAIAPTRFSLILIGVFGVTALALASVGLYGVLSSVVRQRVPEIGVRIAFGAGRSSILRLVVGQGLKLTGLGLAIGLVAAFGVTGVMESLLVGVDPDDPATFAGTALVFFLVAAASCYLPARRATLVDPMVALREE